MDAISNTVCSVIDAADFVRNAHADEGFRDAADEAFAVLAEYIQARESVSVRFFVFLCNSSSGSRESFSFPVSVVCVYVYMHPLVGIAQRLNFGCEMVGQSKNVGVKLENNWREIL